AGDQRHRLEQLYRAAGPDGLHPDLALVQGQAAEDVVTDARQGQRPFRPSCEKPVDRVDDQSAERAEVQLVGVPRAARVRGGLVAVLVDGLVVTAAVQRMVLV